MPPQNKKENPKGDKKDNKKPEEKKSGIAHWHPLEVVLVLFLLASVASAIVINVGNYINSNGLTFYGIHLSSIASFFLGESLVFKIISYAISGLAAGAFVVFTQKGNSIWAEEKKRLFPHGQYLHEASNIPSTDVMKEKWHKIVAESETEDQTKWRQAIIECDVILEGLLKELQVPGDTTGEKLQSIEKSDFLTLDSAWEAHKVRNAIAHGGENYPLNQREVRRVISLYESVFKEFYLI